MRYMIGFLNQIDVLGFLSESGIEVMSSKFELWVVKTEL